MKTLMARLTGIALAVTLVASAAYAQGTTGIPGKRQNPKVIKRYMPEK